MKLRSLVLALHIIVNSPFEKKKKSAGAYFRYSTLNFQCTNIRLQAHVHYRYMHQKSRIYSNNTVIVCNSMETCSLMNILQITCMHMYAAFSPITSDLIGSLNLSQVWSRAVKQKIFSKHQDGFYMAYMEHQSVCVL